MSKLKPKRIKGQTWYQWARLLFVPANCEECGKGVKGHVSAEVNGNWFALCRRVSEKQVSKIPAPEMSKIAPQDLADRWG